MTVPSPTRILFPSILHDIEVPLFHIAVQFGDLCRDRADGREIGGVYEDHEGYDGAAFGG
jgi:hypothetical protein